VYEENCNPTVYGLLPLTVQRFNETCREKESPDSWRFILEILQKAKKHRNIVFEVKEENAGYDFLDLTPRHRRAIYWIRHK